MHYYVRDWNNCHFRGMHIANRQQTNILAEHRAYANHGASSGFTLVQSVHIVPFFHLKR